jgi:hypothetical protein
MTHSIRNSLMVWTWHCLPKDLYKKRNLKPSKSDFRKPFKTGEKFKVTPRGVLMTRKISRVRKRRMLKALYA